MDQRDLWKKNMNGDVMNVMNVVLSKKVKLKLKVKAKAKAKLEVKVWVWMKAVKGRESLERGTQAATMAVVLIRMMMMIPKSMLPQKKKTLRTGMPRN
jgi:hypothetical protein